MITDQGSDSYRALVRGLELCRCLTCEGVESRNRRLRTDPDQSPDLCPRCEGTGEYIEVGGDLRTCSGCLGSGVLG